MGAVDLLVVGVDSTPGWTEAASGLARSLAGAGAEVRTVGTGPVPRVRTFALTDLTEAWLARRASLRGIAAHDPRAVVYCSMTAALLWPQSGAIWLDSIAAENRPGRHGVWQRRVERARLAASPLVMTMSARSLEPLGSSRPESVVVPSPISSSGPIDGARDVDVLAYAGNPKKKRLGYILDAWQRARRASETLVIAGTDAIPHDALQSGVRLAGRLAPADYRALLRRARVFVAAPVREDYGIAQLEALADGCQLVTTPAPGPYPALDIARALDPRLVGGDIASAIRAALDDPQPGYAERAAELLLPFTPAAVERTLSEQVLPRLLRAS